MKTPVLVSIITLLSLALCGSSDAEVLAVTHGDFSTVAQGTNGFQYGYYTETRTTTGTFSTAGLSVTANQSVSGLRWVGTEASSTPFCSATDMHPSGNTYKSAVRRYTVGDGTGSEPSNTGTVRIVGRFFRVSSGLTNRFVTVDGTTRFAPPDTTGGNAFDFTANDIAPGSMIDFGVGVGSVGDASFDRVGLAAWIVTGDTAVPTHLVADDYSAVPHNAFTPDPDLRAQAFSVVTDGVVGGTTGGAGTAFDTTPGSTYTHAGLLYSENSGSGKVTQFNSVRIDVTTAGDFAELPHLFLLRHNSDPVTIIPATPINPKGVDPSKDERYVQLPVTAVRTAANAAGQPYYTFDLTSLPESQRTGYGFTVFGRGSLSGGAIAVSEIAADAVRVPDAGHAPAWPAWTEYDGHRYALSFTRGTWEQTQAEAVSYGGNLISINTASENEWVLNAFGRTMDLFIGLKQDPLPPNVEPRGGWSWLDGTAVTTAAGADAPGVGFVNWESGQPNNSQGVGDIYGMISPNTFAGRTTWGDVLNVGFPTTSSYRGIIEIPNVASPGGERNHHLTVSGKANIFGAGQDNPTPAVTTGQGGVAAPYLDVAAGEKVRLTASGGSVNSGVESAGPDGARHATRRCDITGVAGISGYVNRNNSAHLVGVFVGDTALAQTPARLDFSADAIGEAFSTLSPGLGQVFFIGDGLTPGGKVQEFTAPAGAVKLYLGFPDANSGEATFVYTGPPNNYSNNTGSWAIRLAVTPGPTPQIINSRFPGIGGTFTVAGGQPPYEDITVSAGSLPPGVSITNNTVQGRPTEEGLYPVTLRTEDAANVEGTKTYALNVVPLNNMVAWWKGDTDAQDSAGDNDGTLTGATATLSNESVAGSGSFAFSGADLLSVPHADELNLLGDFSIEGWLRRDSGGSVGATIISKRSTDNIIVPYVFYVLADGRLSFASRSPANPGDDWVISSSSFIFPADRIWRHLAVTCSGTILRFFVDGMLVHTATHPARVATTAPVTIGGYSVSGTNYGDWRGRIDEMALYNRALKASEISAIAKAYSMGKHPRTKPMLTDEDFLFTGGQLSIEGGTGPYSVTVEDGELPAGVEISSTGVVSGSVGNGPYNFTLRVAEAGNPLKFSERVFTGIRQAPIPAPAGLAAWWPGQNTVAEIIGGDHLAVAPSDSFGYGPGKVGQAFHFNGTSQSLQTPVATDVMKHLPLTIEAWIKPEARTSGNLVSYLPTNVIANDRVNFGGHGFGAHLYPDGSMLRVGIEGTTEDFRTVPDVTFTDGAWVHVVVVYTEGNVKTYLDGELKDDYDFDQGELNGGDIIRVGRHNDDTGFGSLRFFKGAIDEPSLYHAELDPVQVQELYIAGSGGKQRHDAGIDFAAPGPQVTGSRWTYGTIDATSFDPSTFVLGQNVINASSNSMIYSLIAGGGLVGVNPTETSITELNSIITLPRQIRQHPGSSGQPSVARWTAPSAGRYAVCGSFTGLDQNGVDTSAYVYHQSLPMTQLNGQAASATLSDEFMGNGQSFTGVIDAEEGEAVDFIVSGDGSYDSTGTFASVVYLGPVLPSPANLTIDTESPPITESVWTFGTVFPEGDFIDLALRVQYAEANTPNDWHDIDVEDGTNSMSPPVGDDVWTLFVSYLELPAAGNYRFRVLASAAGYADKAGPAFGEEALGGTDPIAISVPGQPPPPPAPLSMPAATKMTYTIGGKVTTTAKQGQVAVFRITQPLPAGTPTSDIKVQWSTNPTDDSSWDNLDDQYLKYNKTTRLWEVTTAVLPTGSVYFRVNTRGTGRLATPGPVVNGVIKLIGPVNIAPGPIWGDVAVTNMSSSDTSGKTAKTGETITYRLRVANKGLAPATDVLITLPVPAGTVLQVPSDLVGIVPNHVKSIQTGGIAKMTKLSWLIPSVAPGDVVEKTITVLVKDSTTGVVKMTATGVDVESDELNTVGPQKDIVTSIFSALNLTLTSTLTPPGTHPDDVVLAGLARAGELIYYTLTAENRSGGTLNNAVATLRVPLGMNLESVSYYNQVNDQFDRITPDPTISINPVVAPAGYQVERLITWNLGNMPSTKVQTMRFTARVMYDLQSFRYDNGVYVTNTISVHNYNFTGKLGTKALKAFQQTGTPVISSLSDYPADFRAPNLILKKEAIADGKTHVPNAPTLGLPVPPFLTKYIPGVGVVATPLRYTRITYKLTWTNATYPASSPPDTRLPAEAKNVIVRDEIPSNTTFLGFIRVNGVPLDSDAGFTFLNNYGKPVASNAFSQIRFIEYAVGNLGAGASGQITYDVNPIGLEGTPIVSRAQGALIPTPAKGGVKYQGYAIWCDNRLVGGVATPPLLTSYVVPGSSLEPTYIRTTNNSPKPGESVRLEIPYTVNGPAGIPVKDFTVTVAVPQPFTVPQFVSMHGQVNISQPLNATSRDFRALVMGESVTITPRAANKDTLVTFNLTSLPAGNQGVIGLTVYLPTTIPSSFLTPEGYMKDPVTVRAEIKGKRTLPTLANLNSVSADCFLGPKPRATGSLAARAAATPTPAPQPMGELFVGRTFPFTVAPNETFDMIVFFGNHSLQPEVTVKGGKVGMPIPDGLTLESQTPVRYYYATENPDEDNVYERDDVAKLLRYNGKDVFHIQTLDLPPGSVAAVILTFRVKGDFKGNCITDNFLCISTPNAYAKVAPPMNIRVRQPVSGLLTTADLDLAGMTPFLEGVMFNGARVMGNQSYRIGSRHINVANAEFLHLINGCIAIRLPGGRSAAIGAVGMIESAPGNILADDDAVRVAVSHSSVSSVRIKGVTGTTFSGTRTFQPSALLNGLLVPNGPANIVASGGGSLVAAGGGNIVAAGGLNLIGQDGSTLVPISPRNANLVAAGGGNLVAAGGGNIVAAGGLNLIGQDGSTLVAAGGLNLIGQDGSTLVAAGGGNLVAAGGGNIVAAGGLNLTATRVAQMIGLDGGTLTSVPVSGFGAGLRISGISAMQLGSQNAGIRAGFTGVSLLQK